MSLAPPPTKTTITNKMVHFQWAKWFNDLFECVNDFGSGGAGVTVEDEGVPLATVATTLNFVGTGVVASGTGATKDITITSGGGVTVEDEGTPLATTATILDFVGTGVTASGTGASKTINIPGDHGGLTGLADDDHTQYLHKDITRNVTVGYTTDIEADGFSASVTPDFTLEHFKTMTVTSNFTLNVPSTGGAAGTGGHCEYYLTVTGTGPYTLTAGTNLQMLDGNVTLVVGENYILNIHRYSSTLAVAQMIKLP